MCALRGTLIGSGRKEFNKATCHKGIPRRKNHAQQVTRVNTRALVATRVEFTRGVDQGSGIALRYWWDGRPADDAVLRVASAANGAVGDLAAINAGPRSYARPLSPHFLGYHMHAVPKDSCFKLDKPALACRARVKR